MNYIVQKPSRVILLLFWVAGIVTLYFQQIGPVAELCHGGELSDFCQLFSYFYISVYALILLAYGFAIYFFGNFWRLTALVLWSVSAIYIVHGFSALEISDVRTYGYEFFITSFYFWLALLTIFAVAAMLFYKTSVRLAEVFFIFSVLASIFFAIYGRGGIEHIAPIMGGLLTDFSWRGLWLSNLFKGLLVIALFGGTYFILTNLFNWIKDGQKWQISLRDIPETCIIFVIIGLLPLFSIPAGVFLNEKDLEEAKSFVENLEPQIEKYHQDNGQYPSDIKEFVENKEPPRLIDIYEYLAFGAKGSYYFSREEKYCFIILSPGKDFGFYSITSARKWQFTPYQGKSLEQEYTSVCDENDGGMYETMLAQRLGLPKPGDPVAKAGLALGSVLRPALTPAVTGKLQEELDKLGEKDPSIFGQ